MEMDKEKIGRKVVGEGEGARSRARALARVTDFKIKQKTICKENI